MTPTSFPPATVCTPRVTGHHWLLDLSDCQAPAAILEDASTLEQLLPQAARQAGMHIVGQVFHQFAPSGVTGAVILSESHLTVHTWPESKFVAIDVYVCDFNHTNRAKGERLAQALTALFAPGSCSSQNVQRASTHHDQEAHARPAI
jgi:S-adenosylmethionine decarboxylase proenzyme